MSFRANRADPVCGTCRRKSRKCDRARPSCQRCISKGLVCEGYETKFKIYNVNNSKSKKTSKPGQRPRDRISRSSQIRADIAFLDQMQTGQNISPQSSPSQDSTKSSPNEINSDTSTAIHSLSPDFMSGIESHEELQGLGDLLKTTKTNILLSHFENELSNILTITSTNCTNPFRDYILPLAYQHKSLLHAILGLSACHIPPDKISSAQITALEHKLSAIQALGALLLKEECLGLSDVEENLTLSIVLLLLLQDITESGVSSYGTHLNGVVFLCSRIATRREVQSQFKMFLLAALSWFDLLRGMSGPEKLAFPSTVRDYVSNTVNFNLQSFTGCPRSIFKILQDVLSSGKVWLAGDLSTEVFQLILDQSRERLSNWDMNQEDYPDTDPAWPLLADAYRQTALLRILRFPDTFLIPCSDPSIKSAVDRILDISALMTQGSPCHKRLVFPVFMAGADTDSAHQQRYVQISLEKIKESTRIAQPALSQLHDTVWNARSSSPRDRNVPWMEWTCSSYLKRQHDFLFF